MIFESDSLEKLLKKTKRPSLENTERSVIVENLLAAIEKNPEEEILRLAKKFDSFDSQNFRVSIEKTEVSDQFVSAYRKAKKNIERFHKPQIKKNIQLEMAPGLFCGSLYRPFKRVGLYIPRGLVSTLMMTAIPAKMAGVKEIVVSTPAQSIEGLSPEIKYVLKDLGILEVYLLGGVQAIGAFVYSGKVDKIFGPGNAWVTEAKKQVALSKKCAIDFEAGPSEIAILADESANHDFIASDLLSQLEHGPDSCALLVTDSKMVAEKVEASLWKYSRFFGGEKILKGTVLAVLKKDLHIDFLNEFAPEHLSIQTKEPERVMDKIENAGCIFLGSYTPESLGDYASGTNHVLPTGGEAKFRAGLGVADFFKRINYQKASLSALQNIGPTVEILAEVEGLKAHAFSVALRKGEK